MLGDGVIIASALIYMGLLFGIAYYGDQRADAGRSIIANPYIYTLSLAIYCTAWTFYGSVGLAAASGVDFLPIYLGPTLMAVLFWFVLRRIVRITKAHHITSIADFVASRYGKSGLLAGMVTVIAVLGVLPYISIQLKAIATSFNVLRLYPEVTMPAASAQQPVWMDTTFYVALVLVVFAILFGTRHIDNTERHEGMVAAVAFESLFKLVVFVLVGVVVTFGLFNGPGDLFRQAAAQPDLAALMRFDVVPGGYGGWLSLTFLAMMAFLFLPRQFQAVSYTHLTGVVEGIFVLPDVTGTKVQRLMALVVAPHLGQRQLLTALADRLDPVFLPRPLIKVTALPRNETGKITREAVLTLVTQLHPSAITPHEP